MNSLATIFGDKQSITVAQECARAVVILLYGVLLVRMAGRPIFGKWSPLDIIVSVIVGSALSRALTGNAPLIGTIAATALLIALHWLLAKMIAHRRGLAHVLEGRAVDIATGGAIDERTRLHHSLSHADIDEALRGKGVRDIADVERMTLEPSGKLNVQKG